MQSWDGRGHTSQKNKHIVRVRTKYAVGACDPQNAWDTIIKLALNNHVHHQGGNHGSELSLDIARHPAQNSQKKKKRTTLVGWRPGARRAW